MIVFYGRQDDPPLMRAVEAAQELCVEFVMLDQDANDRNDLLLEIDSRGATGTLKCDGGHIPLATVAGAYARPLEMPVWRRDRLARLRAQVFHELFMEWMELTPVLVLNRPMAMESNSSKPFQAQQIIAAGFPVPETLVTSDPEAVHAFWTRHRRIVYKSVSGIRSIVREVDESAATRFDRLRNLPVQFQAYVEGDDVRVHVVGTATFAAHVQSQATDYRYAVRDGLEATLSAYDLPDDVRDRCVSLAAALRLPFCGIDLRRRPDGSWVCFEVNPMPAYTYFETGTRLPISRAVIELIAGRRPANWS